jgi:hypothetical protein
VRIARHYRFFWTFVAMLVFCSFMVDRQFRVNQARHNDVREAFILLHAKGYTNQAHRLFQRLLAGVNDAPDHVLLDDFQRTMMLVDVGTEQKTNLVWQYHWTVSNELDRRSARAFARALHLAEKSR